MRNSKANRCPLQIRLLKDYTLAFICVQIKTYQITVSNLFVTPCCFLNFLMELLPLLFFFFFYSFFSVSFLHFIFIFYFWSNLFAQHGAWTHDPAIKSRMPYCLSQPGAPIPSFVISFITTKFYILCYVFLILT